MRQVSSSMTIPSSTSIKLTPVSATSFNVLGFVPALVVQHFLNTMRQTRSFPESQVIRSIVMFVDISGFTNLTEALSKIGNEGAEVIAFAINRYMELLVQGISRSGGDIFKFAGDAMIVLWPPPFEGDAQLEHKSLKILMRQAIQSALDIQAKLNDTNIFDKIKLSVKIGFGIGDINIIYVGGVFSRCEYIATGDPLNQAFESEHHAKVGGETIVSRDVFNMVEEFFEFEEILETDTTKSQYGPFHYVKDFKNQKVRMKADALLIKTNLTATQFEAIKPLIMSYIPAALIPYIDIDQESWSAELRRLTIMFVNLGVDLAHAKTPVGLSKIQLVIETVQKCIYYHQGSLNKLLMDDKGSTLIVVFGFPPLSHQDDPIRAILTGLSLVKELGILKCVCSVGIATGTVFAGVIGTSGSRREYSVLGDSVNLAARLMQQACSETTKKVICCETTAVAAQHKLMMRFYKMVKLKGKDKDVAIYEPTSMNGEEVRQITKVELFADLKTHQNSLILNDAMLHDTQMMERVASRCFSMVGRKQELLEVEKICDRFMKGADTNGFIIIRGTYGIGKTLFIRVVLRRIKMEEHIYLKDENLTVIVASLGPMTKTLKANGFRCILAQLFLHIGRRKKREANLKYLVELVPRPVDVSSDNYELFQELVDVKCGEWIHAFPPPLHVNVLESRVKAETKQLTQMTLMLFAHFVDESAHILKQTESPKSHTQSSKLLESPKSDTSQQSSNDSIRSDSPDLHTIIVVLEDLNLYDGLSFHLLRQVLLHYRRILFIATIRDQYSEVGSTTDPIKKQGLHTYDDVFSQGLHMMESSLPVGCFHTLDIGGLLRNKATDELRMLIKQQFNLDDFVGDRQKVTSPPTVTPPDVMRCIEAKLDDHLIFADNKPWLWQRGISSVFYQYVYLRTGGNPLTIINMIQGLMRGRFIMVSDKQPQVGVLSEIFRQILDNEETITVEAPQCWVQVNSPIIDKLACLDSLLMRSASVIGDIFDLQTLNKIQPFKDQIQSERLMKILTDMESQEFLEILDISDHNIFYRFTHPFMRETIYQRMTYNQRRIIHRTVAETIQTMTHAFELEEGRERKKLEFHWTQAEQSTTSPHNDRFSHKAKRSIIVKQIQQILCKSIAVTQETIIRQGPLLKKSEKNFAWADRYVVMTQREFRYYYNQREFNANREPLGVILLKNIHTLVVFNHKEYGNQEWVFQMSTSSCIKKRVDMPPRLFYFAAYTDDLLEEWSIYLEFAKAKAVYDEFVRNFGQISFPIGQNQENYDQTIRIDISNKPQRLNFGHQTTQRGGKRASNVVVAPQRFQKDKGPEDPFMSLVASQIEITNKKNLLRLFLQKSTQLFWSHLFEMCVQKSEDSYRTFGQNINIALTNKHLFDVKANDLYFLRQHNNTISQLIQNRSESISKQHNQKQQVSDSDSDTSGSPPPQPSPQHPQKDHKYSYSKMETLDDENYVSEQLQSDFRPIAQTIHQIHTIQDRMTEVSYYEDLSSSNLRSMGSKILSSSLEESRRSTAKIAVKFIPQANSVDAYLKSAQDELNRSKIREKATKTQIPKKKVQSIINPPNTQQNVQQYLQSMKPYSDQVIRKRKR